MHEFIDTWLLQNEESLIEIASEIFNSPECSHKEYNSSKVLASYLEKHGFEVEYGITGQETAFRATYGSEGPRIGFLAEYDALPNLGQEAVPYYSPKGNAGHGCGHNLLGVGVIGAACALKEQISANSTNSTKATIIVYGCPAEEVMFGKIIMNDAKLFNDLDLAVTWHPFDRNRISYDIWLAHDIKNYKFTGKASHAAKFPELGRSALDAAELMNVGVNYLREHVTSEVRIHYAYTSANSPANIVPDFVQTNYFIRAGTRSSLDDVSKRVDDCAKGAALMTGTAVDIELVAFCKEMKVNTRLSRIFYEAMTKVELPLYTNEEIGFAKEISDKAALVNNGIYFSGLEPLENEPLVLPIGTDVAEVSHTVPTVTVSAATMCKGTALHHWAATAQSGMSIGFKGMLYAAKCMAYGSLTMINNPKLIEEVWEEHNKTI